MHKEKFIIDQWTIYKNKSSKNINQRDIRIDATGKELVHIE